MKACRVLISILALAYIATPSWAGTATFDFDSCTPILSTGMSTPLDQTCSGVAGHFSSTHDGYSGGGYSVQTDASTGWHLSQFSGHYLMPNGLDPGRLDLNLSQSVVAVTFTFATADFQQIETPTTIQMDAYYNSTLVGSAQAHGTYGSDTMPMGTLTFDSGGRPFNRIEIWIPWQPLGSTDVLVDNLVFTTAASPTAVQMVSLVPCRVLDTRPQGGGGGPITGGTFQTFDLPQLAQSKGCADLSTAAVYSLNVTLVPVNGAPVGYLTIWPAGQGQPLVSTMNSLDGRIKANAAIVPAGTNGGVSVYVTNTADVVLDIDAYFTTPGASTLAFYSLTPCRVADTRKSAFPPGLGTPHVSKATARDFPILDSPCLTGISATAYSFNVTAVPYPNPGDSLAYLELWPTDRQPLHPVSTLNNLTGTVVANAAIVPAGTAGKITAYTSNDTDLVIDINGYFAPPSPGGLSLYAMAPCRVLDTRTIGSKQPFSGTLSPPVDVPNSGCAVPNTAQGYAFNATVVPSPTLGYLTLWPNGPQQPTVSTLNALDGYITSNMAIVPTSDGLINAYADGTTHLVLDIFSYFAP